ncbi:VCBS repeat-containing protein [Tamlana agarivorans]|uniref:VCBS repeat-containing protein n=1 Tax=Pseudotamlana agarivorans TaxID=481183 RepID=A0ACC5U986_9FLAO|nr:FG-GAP-like repeat-containing protein [Tamlana agarivorans]MBU2950835.1 VCBS repeat-containing protein [Tamlana agarivorans]
MLIVLISIVFIQSCQEQNTEARVLLLSDSHVVTDLKPLNFSSEIKGSRVKKVIFDLENKNTYGSISLLANNQLLADNLNIPKQGPQKIAVLVNFKALGALDFKVAVRDAEITLNTITLQDVEALSVPHFEDISVKAGLDKVNSIKYGGPTIADINQDGYYDFIVNNHNIESSKLYWNNGDGTVAKHSQDLARWYMHDLHGTALGDYDNDGDLDLVVTQGGGNGANPSKANFYKNDDSKFIRYTGDVGINRGGRGRGARWGDFDLDGDLDLMLVNEEGLKKEKPQHFFYENLGDGTFQFKTVPGIQDVHPSRALVTDINGDQIDDIILYGPLSIWQGHGDFTFTNVTDKMLKDLPEYMQVMAIADVDIDNDGDLDLYLARGKAFEGGKGEAPMLDSDPNNKKIAVKSRGFEGVDTFEFIGEDTIKLQEYYYLAQGAYRGKTYPIFLGKNKEKHLVASGEDFQFEADNAQGWPEDISENGLYIGAIGKNRWKAVLVRDNDLFWSYKFSLSGVTEVFPEFVPLNRNEQDVLLKNDNGVFVDASEAWNIPKGGNALGVTVGDFNNDSHQDIFVYRWGFIDSRTSDYMLLNTGNGHFETLTMHGANDVDGPGNGDMGQAFDFDNDGDLDLLNGSEGGQWYLYANNASSQGNFLTVRVGYAPKSHVDAISAEVFVKTENQTYRKRVGSAGEVFSQSLMHMLHFGLGDTKTVQEVVVRWRNGEQVVFKNKLTNRLLDTNKLDPESMRLTSDVKTIRAKSSIALSIETQPKNANKNVTWESSDSHILKVDKDGVVSAVGKPGEKARITASSQANGVLVSKEIEIVDWHAIPIETVQIVEDAMSLFESDSITLQVKQSPRLADDTALLWRSSQPQVAQVNKNGVVKALKAGKTTITVVSESNPKASDQLVLEVKAFIMPSITILNKNKFKTLKVGENLSVSAAYQAGSGNKVISADEGGVRIWIRHFKNEWIPIKDAILVDETALYKTSGTIKKTFSLKGYTPTKDLPEGQFYMIRASFTTSDGVTYDDNLYPLDIVE